MRTPSMASACRLPALWVIAHAMIAGDKADQRRKIAVLMDVMRRAKR
jgi:hypothetical protein